VPNLLVVSNAAPALSVTIQPAGSPAECTREKRYASRGAGAAAVFSAQVASMRGAS